MPKIGGVGQFFKFFIFQMIFITQKVYFSLAVNASLDWLNNVTDVNLVLAFY
jgi:hypothetical protein